MINIALRTLGAMTIVKFRPNKLARRRACARLALRADGTIHRLDGDALVEMETARKIAGRIASNMSATRCDRLGSDKS